ncbi:MAG: hypothetical protein AAF353_19310 [Pseudomonadota bacterium]
MKKPFIIIALLVSTWVVFDFLSGSSESEEKNGWTRLTGEDIANALNDRKLRYDGAWQEFFSNGRTLFYAAGESWGEWEVKGDRYCSKWSPDPGWNCYSLEKHLDGRLRFNNGFADPTEGRYTDR